jgi:hypothetical protein
MKLFSIRETLKEPVELRLPATGSMFCGTPPTEITDVDMFCPVDDTRDMLYVPNEYTAPFKPVIVAVTVACCPIAANGAIRNATIMYSFFISFAQFGRLRQ